MSATPPATRFPGTAYDVVCVAASAGGPQALIRLLEALPGSLPCPLVVVQHLAPHHRSVLHEILSRHGALRVVEAADGMPLAAGSVFLGPPDHHLLVNRDATLSLSQSARVHFVRPSADVLFDSAAAAYGDRTMAVVLTGTGRDGSLGVAGVHRAGGMVIVQDPEEAEFSGMPAAAVSGGSADFVLPLEEIASTLVELLTGGRE